MENPPVKPRRLLFLVVSFLGVCVWSLIHPRDLFVWFLEVFPAIAGFAILAATYRRFRFTTLVYILVWLHALVLVVGGHYTYAEMPFFSWLRDTYGLSRNYYDRLGHFLQGFVPAIVAREVLLRKAPLRRGGWLFFIVVSICLAISAFYELIEWRVAVATGSAADAFLGTQGDPWDTQEDMATAFIGAILALVLLGKVHDRFLAAKERE